jgi:integrase
VDLDPCNLRFSDFWPSDLTAHGFRSTFRDWTAERTSFPREVAEQALAHTLPDKVEAAYRRSDLFEKRRRLMET